MVASDCWASLLVVGDGILVLAFVVCGGCEGPGEVDLALSEFALEVGAFARCRSKGSGRRGV